MSQFEDFIRDELPLRQVVIKAAGNPTQGDGVIAALGTYLLDTDDGFKRYEKYGSGNTDWRPTPTTSNTGAISTDTVQFTDDSEVTTIKINSLNGTSELDTFTVTDHTTAKYIINASGSSVSHCSEMLLHVDTNDNVHITQYGVLGDKDIISFNASVSTGAMALSATTSQALDISIFKFLLS
ncbi:hypothetical protein N9033_00010 [bacterium]|nr:hypothetical protein [bacterium]